MSTEYSTKSDLITKSLANDDDVIKTEDGLIFNPFNPLNTEITLNEIQCILTKYGIPPKIFNTELYRRAFVRPVLHKTAGIREHSTENPDRRTAAKLLTSKYKT